MTKSFLRLFRCPGFISHKAHCSAGELTWGLKVGVGKTENYALSGWQQIRGPVQGPPLNNDMTIPKHIVTLPWPQFFSQKRSCQLQNTLISDL